MSPNTVMILLLAGSAVTITAILLWAPRYQRPCAACGKRSRLGERTCRCGASLVPVRTPEERTKVAALVGERDVDEIFAWLDGANVHQKLGSVTWFALGGAYAAIVMCNPEQLRRIVEKLDELPRQARQSLIHTGEASIIIREGLARMR